MNLFGRIIRVSALCLGLSALLCMAASAYIIIDQYDTLTTTDTEATIQEVVIHAVVDKTEIAPGLNHYLYTYTLNYTNGTDDLHIWGLENPMDIPYFGAGNTAGFDSPSYVSRWYAPHALEWQALEGGGLAPNSTGTFYYESYRAPMTWGVYTYCIDGGLGAEGFTVGMSDMIPEPASLLALATGLLGIAPIMIRRKK